MSENRTKKEIPRDHTWVWENLRKKNFGFLVVISGEDAVITHLNANYGQNGLWKIKNIVTMTPQERSAKNVHGDFDSRALIRS